MFRFILHIFIFGFLTLLTQLGGLAWLVAQLSKRKILVFVFAYIGLGASALVIAPFFGRIPLPCVSQGDIKMHSFMYCTLNRQYVTPELHAVLDDFSTDLGERFDDTTTLVLDANFPFITGFPLLPHLSHNDGRKVDIAFFYQDDLGFAPRRSKSPIGYFAFENGPTDCPETLLSLRWDMSWLQGLWPNLQLEPRRMSAALELLSKDPRVGKVFVEPHLRTRLRVQNAKIRFQGCRAARHDDHIHLQL